MNIGVNRLPSLMNTIADRHDEDVVEALDRFDEAKKRLEKERQKRKDYWRSVNEKLNPPPAGPLQSGIQGAAEYIDTAATFITAASLATAVLSGTYTLGAGASVLHHGFDKIGGYEWLKDCATGRLGWSEQTARTAAASLRILGYGASIWHGATQVAAGLGSVSTNFQNGYNVGGLWSGIQSAFAPAGTVSQGAMRFLGAAGASTALISQGEMLKAHHETTKGQLNQARGLEIDQDVKEAREGVSGPAKRIKALRMEEAALQRGYRLIADAADISLASG